LLLFFFLFSFELAHVLSGDIGKKYLNFQSLFLNKQTQTTTDIQILLTTPVVFSKCYHYKVDGSVSNPASFEALRQQHAVNPCSYLRVCGFELRSSFWIQCSTPTPRRRYVSTLLFSTLFSWLVGLVDRSAVISTTKELFWNFS